MYKFFLAILLTTTACSQFVQNIDSSYHDKFITNKGANSIDIIFSGNINGEVEPCGCRNKPLGGLPQVAGALFDERKKQPLIYIDSGDTFFNSTFVPPNQKSSAKYTAHFIAKSLDKLGLSYITPGDQDIALGVSFLENISRKYKFEFPWRF